MNKWKLNSGRILFPVLIILLWELLYLAIGESGLASPADTMKTLVSRWPDWLGNITATLRILLISFVSAALIGALLGFLIGLSSFWTETVTPIVLAVYSIPKIAIYPVFLVVFGLNDMSKIAFSFFHGFFPIFIICMEATRMIPKIYIKLSQAYRLTFPQKMIHVLIPSIIPQLVVGLRLGFSLCFIGLILGEMFASYKGIGTMLLHYSQTLDMSALFALFLIIVFVALFVTFLFVIWQEQREQKIGKSLKLQQYS